MSCLIAQPAGMEQLLHSLVVFVSTRWKPIIQSVLISFHQLFGHKTKTKSWKKLKRSVGLQLATESGKGFREWSTLARHQIWNKITMLFHNNPSPRHYTKTSMMFPYYYLKLMDTPKLEEYLPNSGNRTIWCARECSINRGLHQPRCWNDVCCFLGWCPEHHILTSNHKISSRKCREMNCI